MEETHQNFRRPLTVTNLSELNHTSHSASHTATRYKQAGSQQTPDELMDHPKLLILLLLEYRTLDCQPTTIKLERLYLCLNN